MGYMYLVKSSTWPEGLPQVFIIITLFCCSYVQLRRERFLSELEGYAKQMEEFETFGDLQEMQRYLKKAQALRNKLDEAQTKVRKK